jgi:type I restriction enzyme S subunit
MSYPNYSQYKQVSAPWLTEIPAHWDFVQYKQFVEIQNGADHKAVETDEGYPVYGSGGPFAFATEYLYDGESVLLGRKGTIDKPLHINCRFWTVDTMYWAKINPGHFGRFAYYLALTIPFDFYSTNTALPSMTKGALNGHSVPRPPLDEQKIIAKFLDRETSKIDELSKAFEGLIATLKEKRQAVISHAVTKGLDPSVSMKDSGIKWLGQVPAHWSRPMKLGSMADQHRHAFVNGPFGSDLLTSELVSEGVPVIYIRDIKPAGYLRVSEWCVTQEKADQLAFCNVLPGDILVAKVGDPPGLSAVYPYDQPEGIVTQDVIRLRVDPKICIPEFLKYLLNSNYGRTLIDNISVESTRTRVGLGDYKQLKFVLPNVTEQAAIVSMLRNELYKCDSLCEDSSRAIEIIQERRTALISAAVTGKIDVRGLVNTYKEDKIKEAA